MALRKKLGSTTIYWTDMENIFIVKDTMTYRGILELFTFI